mmetsp:Transcript_15690/g.33949  ORF Transcript_15690/g.33949 Transcript_15690/m.33949 type:complete len:134 (+) Transcript_15690:322-723(+)
MTSVSTLLSLSLSLSTQRDRRRLCEDPLYSSTSTSEYLLCRNDLSKIYENLRESDKDLFCIETTKNDAAVTTTAFTTPKATGDGGNNNHGEEQRRRTRLVASSVPIVTSTKDIIFLATRETGSKQRYDVRISK